MEGLLAYWKPLAVVAAIIVVATVFRPGRRADKRPGDMAFFGILLLIVLAGVAFYYRDYF